MKLFKHFFTLLYLLFSLTLFSCNVAKDESEGLKVEFELSEHYAPGETVTLVAKATFKDGTKISRLEESKIILKNPVGEKRFEGEFLKVERGVFKVSYKIPEKVDFGIWSAFVKMKAKDEERELEGQGEWKVFFEVRDSEGDDDTVPTPTPTPEPTPEPTPTPDEGGPHANLTWQGNGTCLTCHEDKGLEVHGSVHYQWSGPTLYTTNTNEPQGKIGKSVNSYCINIKGNWKGCSSCHVGKGQLPTPVADQAQLENIDCLTCHQEKYKRKMVNGEWVADEANMTVTLNEAVKTVHKPNRATCLGCHAKAGGGDAVKRGDLALATINTADRDYDVHMATTGGNLNCSSCHVSQDHKIAGRGSDLRPTDLDVEMKCSQCHANQHSTGDISKHVARVACQTCHIPIYAKNASDTAATEATEVFRTWLSSHATTPPLHPASEKANDLTPKYRFWDGTNFNYLLGDLSLFDAETGAYPTSRPNGGIGDQKSKLYPFKYKTAEQPMASGLDLLIALDTSVFFATADGDESTKQGLENMGLGRDFPYKWVLTDTFQALNHQVAPKENALSCNNCHGSASQMNLASLGYTLKGPQSQVCTQCHGVKEQISFAKVHDKHVRDKQYDCSRCHTFSRPERGLR